ncbi:unnamed protein product [Prunus brigantina]
MGSVTGPNPNSTLESEPNPGHHHHQTLRPQIFWPGQHNSKINL